jgi:hypothetical protein
VDTTVDNKSTSATCNRTSGPPAANTAKRTADTKAVPKTTAAHFSITTRLREIGFASKMSMVPLSSSPAVTSEPQSTARTTMSRGAMTEKISPLK